MTGKVEGRDVSPAAAQAKRWTPTDTDDFSLNVLNSLPCFSFILVLCVIYHNYVTSNFQLTGSFFNLF